MAMVRALTDQWATELDQDTMTDAQKESIVELAKNIHASPWSCYALHIVRLKKLPRKLHTLVK